MDTTTDGKKGNGEPRPRGRAHVRADHSGDREVLESGSEIRKLLAVDGPGEQQGLRRDVRELAARSDAGASSVVGRRERHDTSGPQRSSSLRHTNVREPSASILGHAVGKPAGHACKGTASREAERQVHSRASVAGERQGDQARHKDLPDLSTCVEKAVSREGGLALIDGGRSQIRGRRLGRRPGQVPLSHAQRELERDMRDIFVVLKTPAGVTPSRGIAAIICADGTTPWRTFATRLQEAMVIDVPVLECERCGTELVDAQPIVRCPMCKYSAPRAA